MPFGAFCPLPIRLGGDAVTGWVAAHHARLAADQVAKKRTSPLCAFTWALASNGATPTVTDYRGMNGAGSDHAPSVNSSAGATITLRWTSARFSDAYQIAAGFKPRHVTGGASGAPFGQPVFELLDDGIRIRVFDAAGLQVSGPISGSCEIW